MQKSVHEARLLHVFLEHVLDLQSVLGDLVLHAIVPHTVIKDQLHVDNILFHVLVYVKGQLLLHCPEIHGVLNYLEIVIDSEPTWVDWLVEVVPSLRLPAN